MVIIALSSNVWGQSTGTAPVAGASHNYFVTDNSGSGNTYEWSVTKNDLTTSAGSDVTVTNGSTATSTIEWASGLTTGDYYYVHVIETSGTCSNHKVLPVQIAANNFYLTMAAGSATACYDAAVSVLLADATTINYDHGEATISFTITPNAAPSGGYSFDFANVIGPDDTNFAQTSSVLAGNASISGSTVTVTDAAAVTLQFVIDNNNVYNNSSSADAQDFTSTLSIFNAETVNGVTDNGTGLSTDATDVSRPNTSGIGTN